MEILSEQTLEKESDEMLETFRVPRAGIEATTRRFHICCSTTELPRQIQWDWLIPSARGLRANASHSVFKIDPSHYNFFG